MKIYSIPDTYKKLSDDFIVSVNGEKLGVYSCLVSAYPINQVWPGYQRPLVQTENSSFVMLGSDEKIVLQIKAKKAFKKVTVRPTAKNIEKSISADGVEVALPGPGQYSIEFDDKHNVLTVFVNPEKDFDIKNGNDVIYFEPGVHYLDDKLKLQDNQTVFIDEGAIVYGGFFAQNKSNISVVGYGILDCSKMERASQVASVSAEEMRDAINAGNPIFFANCKNVNIDGITIIDSAEWSVRFDGCENVIVDNIKLIGMWRYNADGCDFCNCINATIKNSYLRNFDDCIVVKGLIFNSDMPVENIVAENCVIWCDWGKAMEVGAETCAPFMNNISFRDCYIIHGSAIMMDVYHGDRAEISDITFENINIEYTGEENFPIIQSHPDEVYQNTDWKCVPPFFKIGVGVTMWSTDNYVGNMRNIRVSNINISTDNDIKPAAEIQIADEKVKIENIVVEKIYLNNCKYDFEGNDAFKLL